MIVLTGTNARGYTQPVRGRTNPEVVKKRKTYETHADGKRVRYFEDDEKYSLTEMVCKTSSVSNPVHERNT